MKRIVLASWMLVSLLAFSGCAAILIGAGVAGGVAISEDTAKLEIDTTYDRAWNAVHEMVKSMGIINAQNKDSGKIEANIQDSRVDVKVLPVTSKTVRVEVKARKNLLPNMDLAMTIINRINSKF
ncbi:MAG: DUF3568 family protein [Candidatus Omnitrophica bacterium]|nr:DUF3568 family protein [Candidatus Omnitrophota bacterium]